MLSSIYPHKHLGLEKILLVSCNCPKKNRVGRSVKKIFSLLFWSKMCVLCMFYVDLGVGRVEITLG